MNDSIVEQPQFKTCCNQNCPTKNPQPIENFGVRSSGSTDGYQSRCKVCAKAYHKEWRDKNPERVKESWNRYNREFPEKRKASVNKWRQKNPERHRSNKRRWAHENRHRARVWENRWISNNKDRRRNRHRQWRLANSGRNIANRHRRSARKQNLPFDFTTPDWQRCLDYFNGCCAYCGQPAGLWITIAADHYIPLSSPDCPGTVPKNILPACHAKKDGTGGCNNSKHNKPPEQWLIQKFGEKQAKKILKRIHAYFDNLDSG